MKNLTAQKNTKKKNKDAEASRLPAPCRNGEARNGTATALSIQNTETGSCRHDNSPLLCCERPPARKTSQTAEVTDPRHPQYVYCYLMEERCLLPLSPFLFWKLSQTATRLRMTFPESFQQCRTPGVKTRIRRHLIRTQYTVKMPLMHREKRGSNIQCQDSEGPQPLALTHTHRHTHTPIHKASLSMHVKS